MFSPAQVAFATGCSWFLSLASPAAGQDGIGDAAKGREIAVATCARCHSLDPNLERVPDGRPASFHMIANTPGMTALALSVWFRTPHPSMPNIILPPESRDDVIAFILTYKNKR